jgi:hypothetical protein
MRSGNSALSAPVHCTDSADVDDTARYVGEQLRRVDPSERLLRDEHFLQITSVACSTFLNRLAAALRSHTATKGDSSGFVVKQYFQRSRGNW